MSNIPTPCSSQDLSILSIPADKGKSIIDLNTSVSDGHSGVNSKYSPRSTLSSRSSSFISDKTTEECYYSIRLEKSFVNVKPRLRKSKSPRKPCCVNCLII